MNYSTAIFLISDQARACMTDYHNKEGEKLEMVKTLDPTIKVDDYVIVQTHTRHNMTVVKVVEVDVEPDFDNREQMRWIIGKVDLADFEDLKKQEAEAIDRIKHAEKQKKRRELRETLLADTGEAVKALPIYSVDEDEVPPPAPDTP